VFRGSGLLTSRWLVVCSGQKSVIGIQSQLKPGMQVSPSRDKRESPVVVRDVKERKVTERKSSVSTT
jgi:hypothetical protein